MTNPRAETNTESIEEFTQSFPKTLASFPVFTSLSSDRQKDNAERSEALSLPFSKEILPKTLTRHFCKSRFGQNVTHNVDVTLYRAESSTDSIEDATQSFPKRCASFSFFFKRYFAQKPDPPFLHKPLFT